MATAQKLRSKTSAPEQDVAKASLLATLYTGDELSAPYYSRTLALEICRRLIPAGRGGLFEFVLGTKSPPDCQARDILDLAYNEYEKERKEALST